MCQRFGHVLSKPGAPDSLNDAIVTHFAGKCPDHGKPSPDNVVMVAQVAIGDPAAINRAASRGPVDPSNKPVTCNGCENYVHPVTVRNELGWTQPMCALKGRLLLSNPAIEAQACEQGFAGHNRSTTDGIILVPPYNADASMFAASATSTTSVSVKPTDKHRVDPREYETDKPVTDEDQAAYNYCLRAWRKVDDPEGRRESIFMPIFHGDKLCGFDPRETYGKHRPDLYVDHQHLMYDLAVELLELCETPVLIGPAGTGKTEIFCWMAWLMDIPFYRLSVKKNTEAWHFIGESKLVAKEVEVEVLDPNTGEKVLVKDIRNVTEFHQGRFARVVQTPCVVLVDEPNLEASIYEFLRPVFDGAQQLVLDEDQGVRIDIHPLCFIGCAQNPADDPIYVGTEPMSAADMDRVTPIQVGLPDEATERRIIIERCADDGYAIPEVTLDRIMQIAADIRRMIGEGTLPIAWGLRAQIKVARKSRFYDLPKAYRRALVDGLEEDAMTAVMQAVQSVAA